MRSAVLRILERDVQKLCLNYLNTIPRARFFRRNVGATTIRQQGKRTRFIRFSQVGMADLWGTIHAIHCEIEIKRPGEEPTDEQCRWLDECRELGHIAMWTDSLEWLIEQLNEEFRQRGWTPLPTR